MVRQEKIYIVLSPRLKKYYTAVARWFLEKARGVEKIFLPLPKTMEEILVTYLLAGKDFREFVARVIPQSPKFLEYFEPLYNALRKTISINPELEVTCYKHLTYLEESYNLATKIAFLAIKAVLTGKVNFSEWESILAGTRRSVRGEAEYICHKLDTSAVIIATVVDTELVRALWRSSRGIKVILPAPYIPTPLERLYRSKEDFEKNIREHIRYIGDYVLKSKTLDEAYLRWIKDTYGVRARRIIEDKLR